MNRFHCPGCQEVLEHATAGALVSCPTCAMTLEVPAEARVRPAVAGDLPEVILLPDDRPSSTPRRPRAARTCSECGMPLAPGQRFCLECDTPRIRCRRYLEPHRGTLILVLGILSLCMANLVLGPIAWILGNEDLKKIRAGKMDPEGESSTSTGRTCGMVGTIIGLVLLAIVVVFLLFSLTLFSALFHHIR